jgi:hypothetical protein
MVQIIGNVSWRIDQEEKEIYFFQTIYNFL